MHPSRTLGAGGVLAITAAGLVACAGEPAESEPTSISIALPASQYVSTFDPEKSSGLWFLAGQATYDSLVKLNVETGGYDPWLAEEFEISDDGLTISVTLRDDVDFVDGEHLTAAGFVEVFNYYMDTTAVRTDMAAVSRELDPVATATGEYTLEITTNNPTYADSMFIDTLYKLPIVSPAAYGDSERLATESVGSGPYLVDEIDPEVSVSFVRNPDYWNPDAYPFDTVTIWRFEDKVAALNALKSGQIDATEIEFGYAAEAESAGFRLSGGEGGFTGIVFVDREGVNFPFAGDLRVRQAFNMAFDREAITEQLEFGYGRASSQPFGTSRPGEYVEGGEDRYPYDPERARELLAEAGYPNGLTVQLPAGAAAYGTIDYRPVLEQYLGDIGVTIEWIDQSEGMGYELASAIKVPAWFLYNFYFNSIAIFDLGILHGTQPVSDPEFQEMLATYRSGSQEAHADVLPRMAEYILEQAWFVPVTHPQILWATRSDIVATPVAFPNLSSFQLAE